MAPPSKKPSKEVLEEFLFIRKHTARAIADTLECNKKSVTTWLKKDNLPPPSFIIYPEELLSIVTDFFRLYGIEKTAERHKRSPKTVRSILSGLGIDISFDIAPHNLKKRLKDSWVPPSITLEQVITGELLGDGSLRTPLDKNLPLSKYPTDDAYLNSMDNLYLLQQDGIITIDNLDTNIIMDFNKSRRVIMAPSAAHFSSGRAIWARPWLEYLADIFRENGYTCGIKEETKEVPSGKIFKYAKIITWSTFQLGREYLRWYPYSDDIKRVPADLVLTPRIILHWYVGDGSCSESLIRFSTEGFPYNDIQDLSYHLWREIGLYFKPQDSRIPGQYYLSLSTRYADEFFSYLDRAPGVSLAKSLFPWKFDPNLPSPYK